MTITHSLPGRCKEITCVERETREPGRPTGPRVDPTQPMHGQSSWPMGRAVGRVTGMTSLTRADPNGPYTFWQIDAMFRRGGCRLS